MPRVVPSILVRIIDLQFPSASEETPTQNQSVPLHPNVCAAVAGILELLSSVPPELLAPDQDVYATILFISAILQHQIKDIRPEGRPKLQGLRQFNNFNAMSVLRQALAKCHDAAPPSDRDDLLFIRDEAFRQSLLIDIAAVHSTRVNGEWKASTVLAGSVIEALCMWALQQQQPEVVEEKRDRLITSAQIPKGTARDMLLWHIKELVAVASELEIISPATVIACGLAREFRNLIHPGRRDRLGQECNLATALTAAGAMTHVIVDLESHFVADLDGLTE